MSDWPEGNAIVYCEGLFQTTYGKTAHGLVRRCERYRILNVVDSHCAGQDAAAVLDGQRKGIPIVSDLRAAIDDARSRDIEPTYFIIGLATDGGRLPAAVRAEVKAALASGLNVVSGLHDFLSDDPVMTELAAKHGVCICDVRKPPPRERCHFFSGKIEAVSSLKVAVLGTDSAIGKRTTAWILVDALRAAGHSAELIGTGQTAWMQGARYGVIMDALINDFVSGEIEHAVWLAWKEQSPQVILIEGQGSLMNPAYPGGFEILAAGRPDVVILQHAPARKEYDGFPGYPMHPLKTQIHALELISGKPVIAVTINHEQLSREQTRAAAAEIRQSTGLPAVDVLRDGAAELVQLLLAWRQDGTRNDPDNDST
jgi:uncharacterized NAD-dependent epimerase/dehydratase family protein